MNTVEQYWNGTEIARQLFVSLLKLNDKIDTYIIVRDGILVHQLDLVTEIEAKNMFYKYLDTGDIDA